MTIFSPDSIIFSGSILQHKQNLRANSTLHMFEIVFFWGETSYYFLQWLHNFTFIFYISSTSIVYKGFNLSTSSPAHLFFIIIAILIVRKWHLFVVLICTSPMISDAEPLYMSSLENCLFKPSAQFLNWLFIVLFWGLFCH